MIEKIRIDREYPTYAALLMPAEKWQEGGWVTDWRWSFATTEYYASLYSPRVEYAGWNFTEDSERVTRTTTQTGVHLLERAYDVKIGEEKADSLCEGAIEDFFSEADEHFIGPVGAEELLRNIIQGAVDLRKYAEAIK